jgi:hypothetical protein
MDHSCTSEKKIAMESKVCTHNRMIDHAYDQHGVPTGKMQCLECMAIFDGPLDSGEHPND